MDDDHSVSGWLTGLQQQDEESARRIFERYYRKLVALCRRRLGGHLLPDRDEEDLALSALATFIHGASAGRFPQLDSQDDVGKLLTCIAVRKVLAELRRQRSGVRGKTCSNTAATASGGDAQDLAARTLDFRKPEYDPDVQDAINELIIRLADPSLSEILSQRLDGRTVREIADSLSIPSRRVEYQLEAIRARLRPQIEHWLGMATADLAG